MIHALIQPSLFPAFDGPQPIVEQYEGYKIVYLTPETNTIAARSEDAPYGVSLSGGMGSAFAGERAIQRYGREQVFFWFADVLKEDTDLYRFLHDLMRRWGGTLYWFRDGRRPEEVWEQKQIIPNNLICPCSYDLKVKHFRAFIKAMPRLPQVIIGYKPDETKRQERTCVSYEKAIPKSQVVYPLSWEPVEHRDLAEICQQELGIAPPRVYALGFEYNNCGTDCCRSGIGGRILEAIYYPETYAEAMAWEEKMQAQVGDYTFTRHEVKKQKVRISLRTILQEYVPLARAYIEANPDIKHSEKTILRKMKKWQRLQNVAS